MNHSRKPRSSVPRKMPAGRANSGGRRVRPRVPWTRTVFAGAVQWAASVMPLSPSSSYTAPPHFSYTSFFGVDLAFQHIALGIDRVVVVVAEPGLHLDLWLHFAGFFRFRGDLFLGGFGSGHPRRRRCSKGRIHRVREPFRGARGRQRLGCTFGRALRQFLDDLFRAQRLRHRFPCLLFFGAPFSFASFVIILLIVRTMCGFPHLGPLRQNCGTAWKRRVTSFSFVGFFISTRSSWHSSLDTSPLIGWIDHGSVISRGEAVHRRTGASRGSSSGRLPFLGSASRMHLRRRRAAPVRALRSRRRNSTGWTTRGPCISAFPTAAGSLAPKEDFSLMRLNQARPALRE